MPTSIYILTFNSCNLPEHVNLGWTRCSVRLYIPRPRRCFKCQRFGHGTNTCRQQTGLCSNCGEEAHEMPCNRVAHCANCRGNHPASSINCTYYRTEQEILATQAKENISYSEARRRTKSTFVRPTVTFAEATSRRTNGPNSTSATGQPNDDRQKRSSPSRSPSTSDTHPPNPTDPPKSPEPDTDSPAETAKEDTNKSNRNPPSPAEQDAPRPQRQNISKVEKTAKQTHCKMSSGSTIVPLQGRKRLQDPNTSPDNLTRPKVAKKPPAEIPLSEAHGSQGTRPKSCNAPLPRRTSSLERYHGSDQKPEYTTKTQKPNYQNAPPNTAGSSHASNPAVRMRAWEDMEHQAIPTIVNARKGETKKTSNSHTRL